MQANSGEEFGTANPNCSMTKADGKSETAFEGWFEFVGGTGKYKNITGRCPYGGVSNAEGTMWDAMVDIEY
jgi:hypothetical protein